MKYSQGGFRQELRRECSLFNRVVQYGVLLNRGQQFLFIAENIIFRYLTWTLLALADRLFANPATDCEQFMPRGWFLAARRVVGKVRRWQNAPKLLQSA
jgi:hypothetical protein